MTPHVIEFGFVRENVAYELSDGTGFNNNPIYGVSIVKYNPDTRDTERLYDESKCLHSISEARRYIESLGQY